MKRKKKKRKVDKNSAKTYGRNCHFAPELENIKIYFRFRYYESKKPNLQKIGGVLPKINRHKTMRLVNAFHPLFLLRNREEKKEIYPQTLTLTEHNRILCISGPNAGGKSITLKTVGLFQLMIQSGIFGSCSSEI